MPVPEVSVVMSVFNDARHLPLAIDSVLNQEGVGLEFVIVDDGSTDNSRNILEQYADANPKLHVVSQSNTGLTQALEAGCRAARGEFIARQDVGDVSLPERLAVQRRYLQQNPHVTVAGCAIRWIGPEDEFLGEWTRQQTPEMTTRDLIEQGISFVHPSVMFRRDAYLRAGGYRTQFRFAQDTDLWYRMAEQGLIATCPEVLFAYRWDISGISPENRARQHRLGGLARQCYLARCSGESEQPFLEEASRLSGQSADSNGDSVDRSLGDAAYFVGSQLYHQRDQRCRRYFGMAVRSGTRPVRAACKYAASLLTCGDVERNEDHS